MTLEKFDLTDNGRTSSDRPSDSLEQPEGGENTVSAGGGQSFEPAGDLNLNLSNVASSDAGSMTSRSHSGLMNLLVVAYYFPPMGLSGVQRILKFVKYLPEFGWRPIVLTAGDTAYYAMDESLLEEIQPMIDQDLIRVYRTKSGGMPAEKLSKKSGKLLKLSRASYQRMRSKVLQTFLQPDSRVKWKKAALQVATDIYAKEKIDAILSTAPPYTDFLIARELRAKYGTPYLLDYRDAWVSNSVLNFYATPFHKAYARKLEDDCLRGSDSVTVVNRKMKEVLLQDYNFLTHEDITILPHGYDPEDIQQAKPIADTLRDPEKFRITYAGAFYVGRSPKALLEAALLAMKKEPSLAKDLELVFVGILQKEYQKLIKKMGLEKNVLERGYLDHAESVAMLLASDVLWMTMSDDISSPGKLYEYFGTRKPILGLVPKGSHTEKLLKDYGAATVCKPDDVKGIAEGILSLYQQWLKGKKTQVPNEEFVQSFDRRLLTKELARRLAYITHA